MTLFVCVISIIFSVGLGKRRDTCLATDPSDCLTANELLSTSTITLNDGNKIPVIGLGTWLAARTERTRKYLKKDRSDYTRDDLMDDQKEAIEFYHAIITAIKAGYRHIDSAVVYQTEKIIGNALTEIYNDPSFNIKRQDIWITTKIPSYIRDSNDVREAIDNSLKLLKTDYIDLYLIHSPHSKYNKHGRWEGNPLYKGDEKAGSDVLEIYKTLLEYKAKGKIKSVGVSNFGIKHLESIKNNGLTLPSVNQIEASVFLQETELFEYCKNNNIIIEAYSPISQANKWATDNELLIELADKYSKQVDRELNFAHIMIRFLIDKGFVVLPKSVTPKRIIANGDVFDFKIDDDDMDRLGELHDYDYRICWDPLQIPWEV